MKKIIVLSCILFCSICIFFNSIYADGAVEVYVLDSVKGCANCSIDEDLDVYLDPESPNAYYSGVTVGQDVKSWFNAPSSLTVTVKALNDAEKPDVLTVNFAGVLPDEDSSTPIEVEIPANTVYVGTNPYTESLQSEIDDKLAFVISKPVLDYADNYEIVGEVGKPITPVTLTITISYQGVDETQFYNGFVDYEFPSINGLSFKVTSVSLDHKSIEVEVSGSPNSASTSKLSLVIPTSGTLGQLCELQVPVGKASFNIVDNRPIIIPPVFDIPTTGVN